MKLDTPLVVDIVEEARLKELRKKLIELEAKRDVYIESIRQSRKTQLELYTEVLGQVKTLKEQVDNFVKIIGKIASDSLPEVPDLVEIDKLKDEIFRVNLYLMHDSIDDKERLVLQHIIDTKDDNEFIRYLLDVKHMTVQDLVEACKPLDIPKQTVRHIIYDNARVTSVKMKILKLLDAIRYVDDFKKYQEENPREFWDENI